MVNAIKHVRIVRKSNDLPNPPNGGHLDDLEGNRVGRIRRYVVEIFNTHRCAHLSRIHDETSALSSIRRLQHLARPAKSQGTCP